jgi:phosphonatase-like hydrolase
MIELVVFDMAGTTLHDGDAVSDCFRAALAKLGVSAEQAAVNDVMGLPKPEAIRTLLSASGKPFGPADIEVVHADFVARMKRYYAESPEVREIAGAGAVFAELRRAGVKVALNTGFSRDIVDVILARLGWTDAIDASIASDESPRGRPHRDMIHLLMTKLRITDPRCVAKVGDTPVDLQEGANAGCGRIIGVTTGAFTRQQLEPHPHTHIVDSLPAVAQIVRSTASRAP